MRSKDRRYQDRSAVVGLDRALYSFQVGLVECGAQRATGTRGLAELLRQADKPFRKFDLPAVLVQLLYEQLLVGKALEQRDEIRKCLMECDGGRRARHATTRTYRSGSVGYSPGRAWESI